MRDRREYDRKYKYNRYHTDNKYREKIKKRTKDWCSRNKEKKKLSDRLYREMNKNKIKEKDKIYYLNNKKAILVYHKKYYKENKKNIIDYGKLWVKLNIQKRRSIGTKYSRKIRKLWEDWFKFQNLTACRICGYSDCFASIDFHHTKSKSFGISHFISRHRPCKDYIKLLKKELKKCIVLCSNCHRMLHFDLGREGRDD